MVDRKNLRPDFDDLAFENFQSFLNQRVVFESFLVERNGGGFFFGRGSNCPGSSPWTRGRNWCDLNLLFNYFSNLRFGLDEFNLAIRVAEFGELGLEERVISRVVHEAEVF